MAIGKRPGKASRHRSRPVRFSDVAIIMAAAEPPFDNNQGHYARPDLVISGGEEPDDIPESIRCDSQLVIYSWADFVPACVGYGGPNDSENAVTAKALANALALARRIKCDGDCTRRIFEIWRGWCCGMEQNRSLATGAVEVMVSCRVEL
jgi:hypothetical protein